MSYTIEIKEIKTELLYDNKISFMNDNYEISTSNFRDTVRIIVFKNDQDIQYLLYRIERDCDNSECLYEGHEYFGTIKDLVNNTIDIEKTLLINPFFINIINNINKKPNFYDDSKDEEGYNVSFSFFKKNDNIMYILSRQNHDYSMSHIDYILPIKINKDIFNKIIIDL